MYKRLTVIGVLSLVFGCATAGLEAGKHVSLNPAELTKECKELGFVSGKGGGAFGGMISDADLQRYAMNDMRNKAAAMGATHVVPSNGGTSGGLWASTQGNISGTAYKCPKE